VVPPPVAQVEPPLLVGQREAVVVVLHRPGLACAGGGDGGFVDEEESVCISTRSFLLGQPRRANTVVQARELPRYTKVYMTSLVGATRTDGAKPPTATDEGRLLKLRVLWCCDYLSHHRLSQPAAAI
jgi:hypothetical protein